MFITTMQLGHQHVHNFLRTSQMDTCMVILPNLLRVPWHTMAAIMDTPFLEIMSEFVKPMEHGRVNNQHVVSMTVYGLS